MSGDYSRDTFEELRRYAALRMQQGRVLLDADFNEMVDILKTRIEKLSLDALGNPGYSLHVSPGALSWYSRQKPPGDCGAVGSATQRGTLEAPLSRDNRRNQ